MTRALVLIAAGGFAREPATLVRAINALTPTWRLHGYLDDDPALHGQTRAGLPILAGLDAVSDFPDAMLVVCMANPRTPTVRQNVVRRLDLPDHRFATLIHPTAAIAPDSAVGPGTV